MTYEIVKDTIIEGSEKFTEKLQEDLSIAMVKVIELIRTNTVDYVPVKTGRLKNSLGIVPSDDTHNSIEVIENGVIGKIGSKVPYAKYVEFGTSRMDGRYFLTRGVSESQIDIIAILKKVLKR